MGFLCFPSKRGKTIFKMEDAFERRPSCIQELIVLSAIQLTITILSCLFANYLYTNVSFISSPVFSFKIFSVVYFILAMVLLLPRAKRRLTLVHLLKLPILISSCAVFFHVMAVLYGAPFLSKTEETSTFGLVMAILTCLPVCCVLGSELETIYKVFTSTWMEFTMESYYQCCIVMTIFGAWLGAIPIPLDWDRPWQVWPITCVVGGIVGHMLGVLATGFMFYYNFGKDQRKCL